MRTLSAWWVGLVNRLRTVTTIGLYLPFDVGIIGPSGIYGNGVAIQIRMIHYLAEGYARNHVGRSLAPQIAKEVVVAVWKQLAKDRHFLDGDAFVTIVPEMMRQRCLAHDPMRLEKLNRSFQALFDPPPHLSMAVVDDVNRRALKRLTEAEREVLAMGLGDALSYGEIAELLGRSVSTVRLQIIRSLGVYRTVCREAGIVARPRGDTSRRPLTLPSFGKADVRMRDPDFLEIIADYFCSDDFRGERLVAFKDEVDADPGLREFIDVLERLWLEPPRARPSVDRISNSPTV